MKDAYCIMLSYFLYRSVSIQKLAGHLQNDHTIQIDSKSLQFDDFDDVLSWKEKEECDTHSWYVQQCAAQVFHGREH